MYRFYCPTLTDRTPTIAITDKHEIHHIKNVLRYKQGSIIRIFNGQGTEAEGTITALKPERIDINCTQFLLETSAPQTTVILACAIPKKSKFETIIEKATELGAAQIIPLKTQRTETTLSGDRAHKKNSRYETIALNASKQSQRKKLPQISPITTFKDALKTIDADTLALIPCLNTENRNSLVETLSRQPGPKRIMVFIGPEGDFTPEEVQAALAAGCLPVSLGETVLKVETAALAVLSFIRFHLTQ